MDDFDLDFDEVLKANDRYRITVRNDDRRICACGHGMSRHRRDDIKHINVCKPGAYQCPCLVPKPVLEVPNTRFFMRKSAGSGEKHAIAMGYAASKEAYSEEEFSARARWLIPKECEFCGAETNYYPVRVTPTGKVLFDSDEDEGVTAFLCSECRDPVEHGK